MADLRDLQARHKNDPDAFARDYLAYVAELLGKIDPAPIADFIRLAERIRREDKTLFFLGNGGSAATASHFANDLSVGLRSDPPLRAHALTDNVAVMTALANDEGYDRIFLDQLKVHLRTRDAVVAISASGNSPNVIQAVDYAKAQGAEVVGITGFDGGGLKKRADIDIHVPCPRGEYGPVEDIHMVVDHLVHAYLIADNPR